jgi:hypothetical protein
MSEASFALKESPVELSFDPGASPNLTVRVVATGTITGCGAGDGTGSGAAGVGYGLVALPAESFDDAVVF